jgi:hypothetical protein
MLADYEGGIAMGLEGRKEVVMSEGTTLHDGVVGIV